MNFATPDTPTQSVYWHFRINDLSDYQLEHLKKIECEWIIIGNNEKQNQKGEHYHVCIKFHSQQRFNSAKKKLLFNQLLTWDKQYYLGAKYKNSTIPQFVNYAIKSGIKYQRGYMQDEKSIVEKNKDEKKISEEKIKLSKAELNALRIKMVRENNTDWFLENDFTFMLSAQYGKLVVAAQEDCTNVLGELNNYWIYGHSGTGKSSSVHFLYPGRYVKVCSNEKWDNYNNHNEEHKIVHIEELDNFDDIDKGLEGLAGLKAKADRYPFPVRFNYGSRNLMIRPTSIIITSNFSPSQILSSGDKYGHATKGLEIQLQAISRKFKVLHISEWIKLNCLTSLKKNGKIVGWRYSKTKLAQKNERVLMELEDKPDVYDDFSSDEESDDDV